MVVAAREQCKYSGMRTLLFAPVIAKLLLFVAPPVPAPPQPPMSMNSDLEELLMLSLLKLQGSGALPVAVNQRVEEARTQGPGGKILALRAGLIVVPQEVRDRCLGELPPPLAALAAASVHMPEESVVGAVAVIAPLVTSSSPGPLNPADMLPVIGSLQATLHSMPPAARRAAAAELPPTQGAMLTAVAKMTAADVAAMMTIVQPAACNPDDSESTRVQPSESAAAAPSGLRLGDTAVSEEALGAVHRLLVALPASARAELAEALPAPVQPLVGMAADLDADDFKQACSLPRCHPPLLLWQCRQFRQR